MWRENETIAYISVYISWFYMAWTSGDNIAQTKSFHRSFHSPIGGVFLGSDNGVLQEITS